MAISKRLITLVAILGINLSFVELPAHAESPPTVTITSPSSGTTQKGKVVITGLATPDSSGSARIIEIGIKVTGKSTSSGFDKREIVYVETGQTSNQTSWSFGTAGTADGVWTPEARDAGKFSLSFDTTSWPNQTYEITLFAKDSNQRSSASKSIEFTTLALAPTVTITSPSSGTTQKGKVVITGLATPDSSGSARIIEIGIKVTGKSTSSGFDKREIVYVETGQTSNQTSWSFGTAGTADGVWTPEARDAGKFSLSFDTTSWPNQTYEITLFAKDSNQRSSASKSIEFTKPRGPIVTIENEMSCELENKSYVGYTTTILCKSRKEIPEVPVVLEYLKGNTWTTFSKDKLFEGSSGYFDILFNRAGTTKVRLKSPGFMKQISPYYENVQVKPFISNELTVKTVAALKSNPNTGSSISGQGTYSVPKGKVDKKSNAYKFMFTAGKNFAKVSLASDTARSQCLSALNTGLIKVRGIPQYLGAQASQIRSYLKTPSGFQGCLDGFGK